ncbi:MAG TPA: MBL fold metallo-hydrolase [Thermoanaerobaculia bacterium]|nr:MBL fold metallo-hydrolase [Thermoanaerobaculia bacterium]
MADLSKRLPTNVEGEFFVDETCIDCDACRQIAPATFDAVGGRSAVRRQPAGSEEIRRAGMALVACPTASIGSGGVSVAEAVSAFPDQVADRVYFNGFTSESSFGAFSYLALSVHGNVMIDSPRFHRGLARGIAALGGARRIALTHRDDVADHVVWAAELGADRVLHAADVTVGTRDVEIKPEGEEPYEVAPDLLMIPTPGHTRGHAVFLFEERVLFTGDHLAWHPTRGRLYAFRDACWYSWREQIRSMERLLDYRFESVLPGHGRPIHLPAPRMREELQRCIEWMGAR